MSSFMFLVTWYVVTSVPVFIIANKLGHQCAFFAFIPIANLWLLSEIADTGVFGFVLLLVPYISYIAIIWNWVKIADTMNKPPWMGIFMPIPIVNIGVAYYIAVSE